ncbi:MAG: ankyrin repeat domain-containing protein [Methylococcales bacterium]
MKILEYIGLDVTRCKAQYKKVIGAIERDDFRTAEVKKLSNPGHGKFYRARLDYANRLLFTVVRHGDAVYALMLEVIENHAYNKSRFLRGATVDDEKIPAIDASEALLEAEPIRYIHPERRDIHLLDKVISFDDAQESVYRLPPPLIVVGSAGSGKTALTLEKMKHTEGEVLYVTHSAYLAQNARDLYYSYGFDRDGQEANFLSYREFVEAIRVPRGREATWRDFSGWFRRMQQQFKGIESHQAFEEIRGVIAADAGGLLGRDEYRQLGVRQSIFAEPDRDRLYDLFEKYRAWLEEAKLYDLNLIAHEWGPAAEPCYDFVVIDEVQDITNAQLALILKTLKKPGQFLLCGDSNQIVHPNFFSWSKVKSLFWRDPELAERQELKVLRANFRNSRDATRAANTLLKIKHKRFGSIDRESNFLVQAVANEPGAVTVLADKDKVKKDLNQKTKTSTRFAVLVMRDEDKSEARKFFDSPLIFSIHEAKGLEYENIILYRFVSDNRLAFSQIADGVTANDIKGDDLEYRRAKDKTDKSLEIYKFFINALYVALTRAVRNVYLIESDSGHPFLQLMQVHSGDETVRVEAKASTLDDWQKEARKLELQGKQEQADAIRATILKETPVPWPVFDEARLRETLIKVFKNPVPGSKFKRQLYEYAVSYDEPELSKYLETEAHFEEARHFQKQRKTLGYKHLAPYYGHGFKEILRNCERHGVDHRTAMNLTPLMAASVAGNVALVEELLERGADRDLTDHLGRNALHWAMIEAFREPKFATGGFAAIYERIAPPVVDLMVGERLVRIDRHLTEYFLLQTLWSLFKFRFVNFKWNGRSAFDTAVVLEAWEHLPRNVLKPERNKRQHISAVLSRNEVDRDYAYNRRLFKRIETGWYQFNLALALRRKIAGSEEWIPIFQALNLKFIKELSYPGYWETIDGLLAIAGIEAPGIPIAAEEIARRQAENERERMRRLNEVKELQRRKLGQFEEKPAPWGTRQARQQALDRLRKTIEASEKRGKK